MAVRDIFSNTKIIPCFENGASVADGTFVYSVPADLSVASTFTMLLAARDDDGDEFELKIQYSEDGTTWYDEVADQNLGNSFWLIPDPEYPGQGLTVPVEITSFPQAILDEERTTVAVNLVNPANSSLSVTEQPDKLETRYARVGITHNSGGNIELEGGYIFQAPVRVVVAGVPN